MSVSVEFKWKLANGIEIWVEAEGWYRDDSIWPLSIGFSMEPNVESVMSATLSAIKTELSQIEDHAAICLCEKAREEILEAV